MGVEGVVLVLLSGVLTNKGPTRALGALLGAPSVGCWGMGDGGLPSTSHK